MKNENGKDSKSGGETDVNRTSGRKSQKKSGRNSSGGESRGSAGEGRPGGKSNGKSGAGGEVYPGFDENMFPTGGERDRLPVTAVRPFTRYRAVEMGLCVAAIILGLLYLYTDLVDLSLLLPAFSVGMAVITALRVLDGREALDKNSADTGKVGRAAAYFPAVFSGFLTVVVIVVTVAYFTGAAG